MALQRAIGATIGFAAALPATWDDTGFEALTYLPIGCPSSLPPLDGVFDIASFDCLDSGEETKFADMMRAGEGSFMVGLDDDDTGQIALEAAKGTKGSFEFTLSSGVKYYRTAVVLSYQPTEISVGNVVQAEINLAFEKKSIKVAAP